LAQYKVLTAESPIQAEELMNEMAKNGWKVVSTSITDSDRFIMVITFIREIADPFKR
jgi:hypothetical protein